MYLDIWISSVLAAIISQKGSDAWWYMKVEELLPEKYRNQASSYVKGTDTMDVWFDSGIQSFWNLSHILQGSIYYLVMPTTFSWRAHCTVYILPVLTMLHSSCVNYVQLPDMSLFCIFPFPLKYYVCTRIVVSCLMGMHSPYFFSLPGRMPKCSLLHYKMLKLHFLVSITN